MRFCKSLSRFFFLQFPDKKGFIREKTESTSIMSHACFEPKNSVVNLNHKNLM